MAYTYHGTRNLITAPGRGVQTFPSGLVRIERTYLCRRGDEARYRSELAVGNPLPDDDGAPAIDGVYIFPEPQEQSRDDGFVEFRVTAYGRTTTYSVENVTRQSIQSIVTYQYLNISSSGDFALESVNKPSLNEIYTFIGVLPSNVSASELVSVAPTIANPLIIPLQSFLGVPAGGALTKTPAQNTNATFYITFNAFDFKNFGNWNEFSVTWKADAIVQIGLSYTTVQSI